MKIIKAILASLVETVYLLVPIVICLCVLVVYGSTTTDGKKIEWLTLSDWGFLSTFLYITVLRTTLRTQQSGPASETELKVFLIGSLVALNAALLGILYAFNAGLIPAPPGLRFLGTAQALLLVGSLLFHWLVRYQEYMQDLSIEKK
jgi:hypothetical protein